MGYEDHTQQCRGATPSSALGSLLAVLIGQCSAGGLNPSFPHAELALQALELALQSGPAVMFYGELPLHFP